MPEASFEPEPTTPVPPRIIQARTQTAFEQGIPGRRFSHFGYPFDSESEQEVTETAISDPAPQVVFPETDDLELLFSDQAVIQHKAPTRSLIPSPSGTSAPQLSKPSLTDTLNNFPLFSHRTGKPSGPEPLIEEEQPQEADSHPAQPNTSNCRGRS